MKIFTQHPNQLIVKTDKKEWEGYLVIGLEEIREAAKALNDGELKLYLYLAENKDKYEFALSPKDFIQKYGVSESTYRRAKRKLVELGYLQVIDNKLNFFTNLNDNKESREKAKEELQNILLELKELLTEEEEKKLKEKVKEYNLPNLKDSEYIEKAKELTEILSKQLNQIKCKDYEI